MKTPSTQKLLRPFGISASHKPTIKGQPTKQNTMKTPSIRNFFGLLGAIVLLMPGLSQAAVITFDSQASFDDNFTASTTINYNATAGGLLIQTSTNYALLDDATFLDDTITMDFQQKAFTATGGIGVIARSTGLPNAGEGIVGYMNLRSTSSVRLRIGIQTLASTFYDTTFTSGISIADTSTFRVMLEQRNTIVGPDTFAEFNLTLFDVTNSATVVSSGWQQFTTANTFTSAGQVGFRAFPSSSSFEQTIFNFSPVPEPTTAALMIVTGLGFLVQRRSRRGRNSV